MDLKEAIYSRRATREFTADPIDEKTVRALIDAAVQAPSAVNTQPWSFCVIRDKALLARLSREIQGVYGQKHPDRAPLASFQSDPE